MPRNALSRTRRPGRAVESLARAARGLGRPARACACVLLSAALFPAAAAFARPQQPPVVKLPPTYDTHPGGRDEAGQIGSREELLRNVEVRRREAVYKENLERAKESAQLGTEIREAFRRQNSLGQAEMKKLGRLEKLAKSIRNENGGDDDEKTLEDPPRSLSDAVSRLAEMTEDFKKSVEKTPKHVVSTSVINSANQMLELIRLIRTIGG